MNLGQVNSIEKVAAWAQMNQGQNKTFQDIVTVNNDGAWREELEIELRHFIEQILIIDYGRLWL